MSTKFLSAVIASAFLAVPALAASGNDVSFRFQAHELDTSQGAEIVYDNLVARAESVCLSHRQRSLSARRAAQECVENVTEDFVAEIDHPRLNQLHAQASGAYRYARD